MEKDEIKKILEKHLKLLSKISDDEILAENPVLLHVINEGFKTISFTLVFLDKI